MARKSEIPSEHATRRKPDRASRRGDASDRSNLRLSPEEMEGFYRTMSRVRGFDEKVTELFEAGEIKGTAHSYVGQEAVAAGVCANLTERDFIASHHRGHGHCIAKGASMDRMMAELMGRETGYCRGLGGSMHIADLDLHILGANGIVGASMPLSCGAALAAKRGVAAVQHGAHHRLPRVEIEPHAGPLACLSGIGEGYLRRRPHRRYVRRRGECPQGIAERRPVAEQVQPKHGLQIRPDTWFTRLTQFDSP